MQWPLFAIALFFALMLGCKKDLSIPSEIAKTTEWKVSQEQFDNAKASLTSEAATRFFDFNYAAQNNPNVVAAATGRDENEDALRALQANPTSTDDQLATVVQTALLNGALRYLSPLDFANFFHGIIPNITHLVPTHP